MITRLKQCPHYLVFTFYCLHVLWQAILSQEHLLLYCTQKPTSVNPLIASVTAHVPEYLVFTCPAPPGVQVGQITLVMYVQLSLCPFLMAIFQVNLVSQCLLKQRMMEVVVTTGAISCAKLRSNHHHQQTNNQFFYRPDALPVTQPTVSRHWRE